MWPKKKWVLKHKSLRILRPVHEVNQDPCLWESSLWRLQKAGPLENGTAQMSKLELEGKEWLSVQNSNDRSESEGGACPWPQLIPSMAWKSNPLSKELRWRPSFVQKFQWQKIMAIPSLSCKFVQSSSCFHRPLENANLLSLIAHAWSEEWRKQITQLI